MTRRYAGGAAAALILLGCAWTRERLVGSPAPYEVYALRARDRTPSLSQRVAVHSAGIGPCSGVALASHIVATSYHCVAGQLPLQVSVTFGDEASAPVHGISVTGSACSSCAVVGYDLRVAWLAVTAPREVAGRLPREVREIEAAYAVVVRGEQTVAVPGRVGRVTEAGATFLVFRVIDTPRSAVLAPIAAPQQFLLEGDSGAPIFLDDDDTPAGLIATGAGVRLSDGYVAAVGPLLHVSGGPDGFVGPQ